MSKAHIMKVPLTTDHFGVKRIGPGSEHATWKAVRFYWYLALYLAYVQDPSRIAGNIYSRWTK